MNHTIRNPISRRANTLSRLSILSVIVMGMLGQYHVVGDEVESGADSSWVKTDLSQIETPEWQMAIEQLTKRQPLTNGQGQISLLRVMLEDEGVAPIRQPENQKRPMVNGVRLFIPGLTFELSDHFTRGNQQPQMDGPKEIVQLASTKLNGFEHFPGGGGRYREVEHGTFVIVEHINSSSRLADKDPVEVGSFVYGSTTLMVPVPPRGELGIFGDVILKRTPVDQLGRIVAEIVDNTGRRRPCGSLQVGNKMTGGIYGRHYKFSPQGFAASDQLSPGTHKIVLPGFDVVKSRWDITVEPGRVTYLRFQADSHKDIRLLGQQVLSLPTDEQTVANDEPSNPM